VLLDLDGRAVSALAARLGPRALACEVDVTDPTALRDAVAQASTRFGGIDVAIANAGIGQVGTLMSTPDDAIDRTITVNLLGVWRTNRAVIPQLLERRGYLLNVASLAAATHTAANGAYAASKAAVEALTDALRIELAGTGVAVGCAYFGYIDTELERASVQHPTIQALQRMMPNIVRRPAPVSTAVEAIERAIVRRAPRVYAPRYIAALLGARGILQPLSEWRTLRQRNLIAALAAEVTAACQQ
jgi:NAD(P)-dependent dehydrogenase (short-subunit alcohol dehydrogenase family)